MQARRARAPKGAPEILPPAVSGAAFGARLFLCLIRGLKAPASGHRPFGPDRCRLL